MEFLQASSLTTGTDVKTGGAGADQFLGVVGATSTLTAGDLLTGGEGVDTLSITLTGGSDLSLSGVVSSSIEKYSVSNYTTVDGSDDSIDMSQASGIEMISLTGSNGNGDTVFTNVGAVVDAEMMSGTGDLTITNTNASVAGTANAASLTLSGQTLSTFTEGGASAGGLETLNVASNGATNDVDITSANNSLATVNISGASKLTTTVASTGLETVNAADMTGALVLTTNVTGDLTITGGSAADTITFTGTTYTNADVVDGGEGDDTLVIGTAITAASTLKNVSNVELVRVTGATNVTLAGDATVMAFNFTDVAANALTLNAGVTEAVSVTLGATAADSVTNNASTTLTVSGAANAIDTASAITGGALGADTILITADTNADVAIDMSTMTYIDAITVVDNGDAAIAAAKGAAGKDINLTTGSYATAITIDASALDAAITDDNADLKINDSDESAERLTVDGSSATAVLTIKGGEAGDTITGGTKNDIIHGNGGNDTITLTAGGNDTVEGGAGDDTIDAGSTLTAADTIDGGDGDDTLVVTQLTAAALAGVTNVETLAFNGTVSLSGDLSFDTLDLTNGSSVDSVTFATGYTKAMTVALEDQDTVINNAKIALAITAKASDLESGDAVTITGSALAADTMTVTATSSTMATSGSITNVDAITVKDGGDGATTAGKDFTVDLASYGTKLTIDASALDVAAIDSDANGKINASDASNEKLTITGTSAKALTVIGGGADDTIVGSSDSAAGDTITAGAGDDIIDMTTNLDYTDTIDGGDNGLTGGGDELKVAIDQADINFMNVTNVEKLSIDETGTSTNVLGAYFSASGITTVNLDPDQVATISAAGTTAGVTYISRGVIDESITAGLGDDSFVFGAATLTDDDVINGGKGTDTIAIANTVDSTITANVDLKDVTNVEVIATIDANGDDTVTPEADAVTINVLYDDANGLADNGVDGTDVALTISGASITDTLDVLTVDASAIADTDYTFTIIGGAAADVLTGGGGADTISGGTGADTITGKVGADTLTGGAGKDDFVYALASSESTLAKTDTITDFETGSDEIRISFTGAGGATYDFTNKGEATNASDALALLSSVKGQYYYNTTSKTVVLDTNGNGLAQSNDFGVVVGTAALGAADIAFDLTTGGSADTITTGGGNDTIVISNVDDVIVLGAGNDLAKLNVDFGTGGTGEKLSFGAGTDTLQATGSSAKISGVNASTDVSGLEKIVLDNGAALEISEAQLSTFNGTDGFTITGASSEVVTIEAPSVAAANTVTAAAIVATEIDFVMTSDHASDVLIGNDGDDNFNVAGGTGVATITGGAGTLDMITTSGADYDATADTITGIEKITLGSTYDISLTPAQLALNALSAVIGVNGSTVEELKIAGTTAIDTIDLSGLTTVTDAKVTITGGALVDVITLSGGADVVVTGSLAADADSVTSFTTTVDVIDLSAALTAATLTVNTQLAVGAAADAATAIAIVDTAADTDAEVYYIENTAGSTGELTLAQIETAIAAGDNATGQVTVIIDNGTDTLVFTDAAAQTDAGSGAGLILQVTLVGVTGATAVATGDFISA